MSGEDKWEHTDPKLGWGLLALRLGKDRDGQSPVWLQCHQCVRCHQHLYSVVLPGRGTGDAGGIWRDPPAVPAPGNIPKLGGAACAGVSKAVQIQPCLAAELVRKSSRRKGLSSEIHLAPPPSHPSHQGHPISCQALLTCPLPIS